MADFTSDAWSWFIAISTVISILGLLLFTLKIGAKRKVPGEKAESMGHVWDEDLYELNNPAPRWWYYLFLISMYWGCLYLFLYPGLGSYAGYLGWSQTKQYEQEVQQANEKYGPIFERFVNEDLAKLAKNPEALTVGMSLFSTYCTTCHGSDAGGARGFPSLRDNDWLWGGDPESIKTSIMEGRQGVMAPWGPVLGEKGVLHVTEYVKSLSGRKANEVFAEKGKTEYAKYCVVCHNADGTGNTALGAPNLTDDIWLYGGSNNKIMESISDGRHGIMPPHKEFLGEAKVHLLAAYVYSLSGE